MKAMLQFIAAAVCVAVLTACGGGGDKTPTTPVVVQPAYKLTETATGTGRAAAAGDLVTFKYVGYLYDSTKSDFKGAKIESSVDLGSTYTATVGVGAMLAGWDQSLLGMQAGTKRTAILPANLAYGANTREAQTINGIAYAAITANAPLVYDFEMVFVSPQVIIPNQPAPTVLTTTDLVVGTGTAVVNGQTVTVRYTGWLYDGTRSNFKGASFDNNQSATTPLTVAVGGTGTITGFNTGIIGMKVGGTRTVIIPPALGYGAVAQTNIPANSTLVFDITLISIQ
ncbi:FKBP-type peptidylprolyl isomerase [Pseudoduganella sp. FT25W]|uniref:Peptidyl-prolyl cis-trans isomerase n=2 Tax=Duganella alba TaxID=2666081 RepID=A0A6L5QBD6_9BURK|nr:FKBP-type peptidylprolyl isomerase [Duganella alba]MRX16193.1 FKBP-type peptidylprolyl isomerase [Duganella alba]